jgi:aldehyde dehydrogenase (NAD+)
LITPMSDGPIAQETADILTALGVNAARVNAQEGRVALTPITGQAIARVKWSSVEEAHAIIGEAHRAFPAWRDTPAPRRGELVRLIGDELRRAKPLLARLVTIESGKIASEGLGEVQEMIDICDFAVGLSRQLYGLTMPSERPGHRMMETWRPLGVVGVITAFNFPVAVWAWNAALALACGNSVVWKPSEKTPLTAIATMAIAARAMARFGDAPDGVLTLVVGGPDAGASLVDDARVALISATGSTRMGREVGPRAARRFARTLLELGGNNAGIICPSADLALSLRAVAFSAFGTAGQRCTTMRRLFVHDSLHDDFVGKLLSVQNLVGIGDPRARDTLLGPLIDKAAYEAMENALRRARDSGGVIHGGERVDIGAAGAYYVRPAIVVMPDQNGPMLEETFAPILYVMRYRSLDEAIALNNATAAGLSSSIFTNDMREAEIFLSAAGSDCGIVNVNIGTSGAEIGGAFGGEKETGGGRESGSDAWKAYMRRATNTVNYSAALPLAQGVEFPV